MADDKEKLQQQVDELSEAKQAFEVEKKEGLVFVTHNTGPIKLNIGGTFFQTTFSTLSNFPSMLSTMLSGRFEIEKDESGAVFIDRDGKYFHHILNFLRDGAIPALSSEVAEALKAEAHYYQMAGLTDALYDRN